MGQIRTALLAALLLTLAHAAACSYTPELYCDEETPCDDPARPFCDLEGAYPASEGIGHTCIPNPFGVDAGVDATQADADTNVDADTSADAGMDAAEADADTSVDADTGADASTADAPPVTHTVTINNVGSGSGTVLSSPFGINCGASCSAVFDEGTAITLTATPESDSDFASWSGGGCSGSSTCEISLTADVTITATFELKQYTLTVATGGDGTGGVTSSPTGIDCGLDCTETYTHGTPVTLTASATGASSFGGWSGDCSGLTGTCQVTMDGPKSVGASFDLDNFTLSVSLDGDGVGSVTSNDGFIDCPDGDCSASYSAGSSVTLTAHYDSAVATFGGWSGGGCSGAGNTCLVSVDASTQVQATFNKVTHDLTVNKVGSSGLVTSTPAGINCGTDCAQTYDAGTTVTLTAGYDSDVTVFEGWTGCTGGDSCQVDMDADKTVTATFAVKQYPLTVSVTGDGTVTSDVGPIDCPGTCDADYDAGTVVTLTPSYNGALTTFDGWTGSCSSIVDDKCEVTMSAARSVTATFTSITYDLTIHKTGSGGGTVTSTPPGINCGPTCTAGFGATQSVELQAAASPNHTFTGWSGGGCSGTDPCTVEMNSDIEVTANFEAPQILDVALDPDQTGTGNITSSPFGISCGTLCSAEFPWNEDVTLTAHPDADTTFIQWQGDCEGLLPTCNLTMNGAKSTTATFNEAGEHLDTRVFGSSNSDSAVAVAYDSSGNLFLAGNFIGALDLSGGSAPLSSNNGSADYFVAKFSPTGSHIWSQNYGTTAGDTVQDMSVDGNGDVIVTACEQGDTSDSCVWTSASFTVEKISGNSGSIVWSNPYTDATAFGRVETTPSGEIVLAGMYRGTLNLGGGNLTSLSPDYGDIFLAWLDSSGNHVRSASYGTDISLDEFVYGLAVDPLGNVAITGAAGDIDFGEGPVGANLYVASFTASGNLHWSRGFNVNVPLPTTDAACDSDGNVYVTGQYKYAADLGGGYLPDIGVRNIFVAKYAATDGHHIWSKGMGSENDTVLVNFEGGKAIAVGPRGFVFVAGVLAGPADLGGGTLTGPGAGVATYPSDLFVASFDAGDGMHRWSTVGGGTGTSGSTSPTSMALDPLGNVTVAGSYHGNSGIFEGQTVPNQGGSDIFLLTYGP